MKRFLAWLCILLFMGSFTGYIATAFAGYTVLATVLGCCTLVLPVIPLWLLIELPKKGS